MLLPSPADRHSQAVPRCAPHERPARHAGFCAAVYRHDELHPDHRLIDDGTQPGDRHPEMLRGTRQKHHGTDPDRNIVAHRTRAAAGHFIADTVQRHDGRAALRFAVVPFHGNQPRDPAGGLPVGIRCNRPDSFGPFFSDSGIDRFPPLPAIPENMETDIAFHSIHGRHFPDYPADHHQQAVRPDGQRPPGIQLRTGGLLHHRRSENIRQDKSAGGTAQAAGSRRGRVLFPTACPDRKQWKWCHTERSHPFQF